MSVERQQGTSYQLSLFEETEDDMRHGAGGDGGTGSAAYEESQTPTASGVTTVEETAVIR